MKSKEDFTVAAKAMVDSGRAKQSANGFENKPIRPTDAGEAYEVGDEIVLPKDEDKVVLNVFIGQKPKEGPDNRATAQAVLATLVKASGGERIIQFYPNSLTKVAYEVDADGESTGRKIKTSGSATNLYQSCSSMPEGWAAIAGRTLRIDHVELVKTVPYGTVEPTAKDVRNTHIYTYELVEPKPKSTSSRKKTTDESTETTA